MPSSAVVIGLASHLAGIGSSENFYERFFSPLAKQEPFDIVFQNPLETLLAALRDAQISAQSLGEGRVALFLHNSSMDDSNWLSELQSHDALALLRLDFEPVISQTVSQMFERAVESLNSRSIDFAFICGFDSTDSIAFVLTTESNAVIIDTRIYCALSIDEGYPQQENAKLALDDVGLIVSATKQGSNLKSLGPSRAPSGSYFADFVPVAASSFATGQFKQSLLELLALKSACASTYLRVLPATQKPSTPASSLPPGVIAYSNARPWIHPAFGDEVKNNARRALILADDYILSTRELDSDLEDKHVRPVLRQSSELFLLQAATPGELLIKLQDWSFMPDCTLAEIARQQYMNEQRRPESGAASLYPCKYRLGIVAGSVDELRGIVSDAYNAISDDPEQPIQFGRRPTGYAYSKLPSGLTEEHRSKVAFVFPGLGASYPNMLADLCFYFPEVRSVFDFVERLAVRANDKVLPSRAIFPLSNDGSQTISQALLATIDSAVVTLLLAQWALFNLLQKLGIRADAFLGCSTGEFAVLTMNSSFNIFKAAEPFYRLSTQVSRLVPKDELIRLRTIRVSAPFAGRVENLVKALPAPVYLGAEMSNTCSLLSGERSVMDELCAQLKKNDIDFLVLPVAIPYHTPLVAGKISGEDPEFMRLSVQIPDRESWSASLANTYPDDPPAIRKLAMNLFEKPIQFRSSIEQMYDAGTRIFLEVAPKGGLIPYVSEILADRPHRAMACNLAERSGIDQLNVLLATLHCDGIDLDLDVLYERRPATPLRSDWSAGFQPAHNEANEGNRALLGEYDEPRASIDQPDAEAQGTAELIQSYFNGLNELHSNMADMQRRLMQAYLAGVANDDSEDASEFEECSEGIPFGTAGVPPASVGTTLSGSLTNEAAVSSQSLAASANAAANPFFRKRPFLLHASLAANENLAQAIVPLSTKTHPFILDHAIGGNLSSLDEHARVYLLPLMVAIEIMAELAAILFEGLVPVKLLDIRALKRIRVTGQTTLLRVESEKTADGLASVTIFDAERENVLASCKIGFSSVYANPSVQSFPSGTGKSASKFSPSRLYGDGSMFHGPAMQAVKSIDGVYQKQIEGKLCGSTYGDWFAIPDAANFGFMIDPLLLDSLSQFVLYQMYEHDLDATALLPFHIASIDLYDNLDTWRHRPLDASVQVRAMSQRGTLASMQLKSPEGRLLLHCEEISSRAIMLDQKVRKIVFEPAQIFSAEWDCFANCQDSVMTAIAASDFPDDETVLDWLTDYVLTSEEQKYWTRLGKNEKRRKQWLMGRIAAKDAVRSYLLRKHKLECRLLDLQLQRDAHGAISITLAGNQSVAMPRISISHCETLACAIAEAQMAGIDIEELKSRDEGFEKLAFTANEKIFLDRLSDSRDYICWSTAFWTAKEASAKAHLTGFQGNPKSFEAIAMNKDEGLVTVRSPANGGLVREYQCSVRFDFDRNVAIARVSGYKDC